MYIEIILLCALVILISIFTWHNRATNYALNNLDEKLEKFQNSLTGFMIDIDTHLKKPPEPLIIEKVKSKNGRRKKKSNGLTIMESIYKILEEHGGDMLVSDIAKKRIELGHTDPHRDLRKEINLVNSTIYGEIAKRAKNNLPQILVKGLKTARLVKESTAIPSAV